MKTTRTAIAIAGGREFGPKLLPELAGVAGAACSPASSPGRTESATSETGRSADD